MHIFVFRQLFKEITHDYICNYKYKLLSVYVFNMYVYTERVVYLRFLLGFTFLHP